MLSSKAGLLRNEKRIALIMKRTNHHYMRFSRMFPSAKGNEEVTHTAMKAFGLKHAQQQQLYVGAAPGTFYLLPMLTRVLEKLYRLIDNEMQSVGAQKITMPCLAPAHIWKKSGRWEEMGSELFTLRDRHESEHCLAPTHEEAVTSLVAMDGPISYKRLPIKLYQIGRKFRDEKRPKHGLLRGREFEMKDLYTFSADENGAQECYEEVCDAYTRLLNRLEVPFLKVEASSGSMGGSQSQEYHLLSPMGEDTLYKCSQCAIGLNKELLDEGKYNCHQLDCKKDFTEHEGIEVAHAFILGTKYSSDFNAMFTDNQRKQKPLYMGCFGIGVTRLLSALSLVLSTPDALVWPRLLAPHQVCIIPQKKGYKSEVTDSLADVLHAQLSSLSNMHREVVLDDRTQLSIGKRVRQATAMGFPHIVTIGKKALDEEPLYEYINIKENSSHFFTSDKLIQALSSIETIP